MRLRPQTTFLRLSSEILFYTGAFLFLPWVYVSVIFLISVLCRYFPSSRPSLLTVGAYGLILWSPFFWGFHAEITGATIDLALTGKIAVVSGIWALAFILSKFSLIRRFPAPILAIVLVLVSMNTGPTAAPFLIGFVYSFKILFWGICYHLRSESCVQNPLAPFWGYYHPLFPTLLSPDRMREASASEIPPLLPARDIWIGSILLALGSSCFKASFGWVIGDAPLLRAGLHLMPSLNLPFFDKDIGFLIQNTTALQRWIALTTFSLSVYLSMAGAFMTNIGIARKLGFFLPHQMNKPWLAKNFTDLYSRVFFYYSSILASFIWPIASAALPRALPFKTRFLLAMFISISMGGFLIHFIQVYNPSSQQSIEIQFYEFLRTFPYFLAIGILACTSPFERHRPILPGLPMASILRPTLLVLISFLVHSYYVCIQHFARPFSYWYSFIGSLFLPQ